MDCICGRDPDEVEGTALCSDCRTVAILQLSEAWEGGPDRDVLPEAVIVLLGKLDPDELAEVANRVSGIEPTASVFREIRDNALEKPPN